MARQIINEIGNRYGLLTVKERANTKSKKAEWICQCDCGNFKIVSGSDLRGNKITTCGPGCLLKYTRNANFKNLVGQRFGRLVVIKFIKINQNHKSVWRCLCDCGNEYDVIGAALINGSTQSCGCLHREQLQNMLSNDYIGQTFGYLTVLERAYDKNNHIIWKCQCKCGNIIYLPASQFTGERGTRSCGCIKSFYEVQIQQILEKQNITFQRQQKFPDLKDKKQLSYDFGIYKNNKIIGLIEYQGEQHFKSIEFYGGEKAFKIQQQHDIIKFEYAKKNNIPLLYLSKEDNNNLENKIINFLLTEVEYNEI